MPEPISVLFCCMGNICRSTMAEGVFQALTKTGAYQDRIAQVDSCGTISYHAGDPPDERTMATLAAHGITDYRHRARKIQPADLDRFDYVFAMDRQNLRELQQLQQRRPGSKARVLLFGAYARPGGGASPPEVIDDPYYGGSDGFAKAYEQATRFSRNFLQAVFPDVPAGEAGSR